MFLLFVDFEILQVKATDADQEGTVNAAIRYKIINQEPKSPLDDMFTINPVNGFIRVNAKGLDREVRSATVTHNQRFPKSTG